jgi:putative peptide zinc metalloprotease protein
MATLRDSLLSSSARKMPVRRRPDLIARRQHYLGRSYWIVKDPVGLTYFRFHDEEYALLQMLDGRASLDELKERFEADFPPQKITLEELQQFLGQLHGSGLVLADMPGQGHQLRRRRDERKRKMLLASLANVLCIRFKGFDPERFLTWLYPRVRWLFSTPAVVACLTMALMALMLVAVQFDVFRAKLPEFHQFFGLSNGVLLVVVLSATKVLHEFGHGLACKHFGGECHEMGVMILVLTPCLYCNVSDSWLLSNKWHRAMIGAAGMYVELTLASLCTFFWWFSAPGVFHNLCLDVMFLSSVTTLVFNANPLLRYDGYYILSDITEIPNLRQKATSILARKMSEWCLGMEPAEDPFLPRQHQTFFAVYSIAAVVYRWIVAASICFFLYKLFVSYRLEIIGKALVAASLWGLLMLPLWQVGKFFYVPGRIDQVKKPHFYTTLGVLAAAAAAFCFLPLPHSVVCPFEIQARDAASVYADVAGTLVEVNVKPGQRVTEGQQLARLENLDVDGQIAKLQGGIDEAEVKLKTLLQLATRDDRVASQISTVQEGIKAFEEQLRQKEKDRRRLRLVAPMAGVVLPPAPIARPEDSGEELPVWSGSPLDPENIGAYLKQGALVCQVGDPQKLDAVLVIDQSDRDVIGNDRRRSVDLKLSGFASTTIRSELGPISESKIKSVSKRLSNKSGGEIATKTEQATGQETPMSTSYQANAPIDDRTGVYRLGQCGQARVYTDWMSLGGRLWRLLCQTFNFRLS